jgi:hypothetical protein
VQPAQEGLKPIRKQFRTFGGCFGARRPEKNSCNPTTSHKHLFLFLAISLPLTIITEHQAGAHALPE